MEKYKNLKKGTEIGLYVSMVLMLICLVINAIGIVRMSDLERTYGIIRIAIRLIVIVLIVVYAFWAYKKPHGNLLRLTMYVFGISLLIHLQSKKGGLPQTITPYIYFADGFAAMMVAFICGRLHKIDKNKKLMIITEIILIAIAIVKCCFLKRNVVVRSVTNFSNAVCWLTLCFAYVARYEEHKAAGLEVE